MESDTSLKSCSRKRSRFNDEKDKNKNKKKTKTLTLKQESHKQEDTSLRSCSTGKTLSEEEKTTEEKKKMKYMMMKNLVSKKAVQAKHFEGKVIVLHFVSLLPWPEYFMRYETKILMDIYHILHPKGGFEVVFIGVEVDSAYANSNPHALEECFEDKLSIMPWTAVPFSNIKFRTYWENLFPLSGYLSGYSPTSFVFDPSGMLLQCNVNDLFYLYGARAYPFTDKRMECLLREDAEARKHPSITKLITSSERTHLINNRNQAVPLHNLEDKVIGLYFYEDYPNHELTSEIQKAYDQLAHVENFEIVFVYIHDTLMTFGDASEKSYWKTFKKMSWLALPFKDPVCKKLQRVFKYPMHSLGPGPDPSLLIIRPQGNFVERYGADILTKYGFSGYPFTRSRVAKLEVECIKKLNINMFWGRKTTFLKKDGSAVQLSELAGKRIIVIVEDDCHSPNAKFWRMLRARYVQVKGTENEFEVIHICKNRTAYSYGENIATMLWLRHPSRHPPRRSGYNVCKILVRVFRKDVLGLFAFDRDGRLVRRSLFSSIERRNVDFPFGDMEEEFLKELVNRFEWKH
ncbi:putative nucleoredoxin 1 [Apium graveolens]|uniref:putative nucleoredoxin 1 n=1 Tax=Apium graveolens TaxID=4045 RepID=UPI003D7ADD1D